MASRYLLSLLLLVPKLLLATKSPGNAGIALVIGNNAYQAVSSLANPVNDAKLMAATLTQLHFDVSLLLNANQRQMKQAIIGFGDALEQRDKETVGLFYYSGHGVQVDGRNFLIPVDAVAKRNKDFSVVAVEADTLIEAMKAAHNRLNFVILDACRNAPFATTDRAFGQGLARMQAARGMLIAYATSPGEFAEDGSGSNSPYTLALASAMLQPKVAVERMFRQVRNAVMQATQQRQLPWESSSLTGGDYFFNPGIATPNISSPQPLPIPTTPKSDREALSLYMDFLTRPATGGEFRTFTDGDSLSSGDLYRIVIRPETNGYLYIFQVDAASAIQRLFPMPTYGSQRLNNLNPVQRGTTYYLPAQTKAFYLDNTRGKETIYVFASRKPRPDLEDLSTALVNAQARQNPQATQAASNKLATLFKSRDLPLVPLAPAPQDRRSPADIGGFFNNLCATCVHVLEFVHL